MVPQVASCSWRYCRRSAATRAHWSCGPISAMTKPSGANVGGLGGIESKPTDGLLCNFCNNRRLFFLVLLVGSVQTFPFWASGGVDPRRPDRRLDAGGSPARLSPLHRLAHLVEHLRQPVLHRPQRLADPPRHLLAAGPLHP